MGSLSSKPCRWKVDTLGPEAPQLRSASAAADSMIWLLDSTVSLATLSRGVMLAISRLRAFPGHLKTLVDLGILTVEYRDMRQLAEIDIQARWSVNPRP